MITGKMNDELRTENNEYGIMLTLCEKGNLFTAEAARR